MTKWLTVDHITARASQNQRLEKDRRSINSKILSYHCKAFSAGFAAPALRWGALAMLCGAGMVIYFGTGTLIGAFRLSDFKAALRRKKA